MLIVALICAATAVYSYRLGYQALGPSEAYSALAAAQPTIETVARNAIQYDPGKTVLYHVLLHWFCELFGSNETALRSFSLIFGLATLGLVFLYGNELFGFEIGFAAAALWAFNPVAMVDARWARMYSLFVALALAHLLAMARLRRKSGIAMQSLAGALGAAMLCSHLGGALLIFGDVLIVLREFRRTGRSVSWPALVIAIVLFLPFAKLSASQTQGFLVGHWLDWIGTNHDTCASSNLNRPGSISDLNRAGVACADGDAAPHSRRGRPERTPNVDRTSVGDGRTASPNRGAQAQRYAPTVFPFSRSAVLAFAGATVARLARQPGDRPAGDGLALAPYGLVGVVAISLTWSLARGTPQNFQRDSPAHRPHGT